jgi:predicted membrane-bound spermidine synthase
VIELVAGRVLAPYVGVSLYTWTSIIGVVLAGISAGAYAGGWLADRRPSPSTLGWLLLAAGITAMAIAPATAFLADEDGVLTQHGIAMTLLSRVVLLSFVLFFLPSFFLGMISPVAVKIAVRDLDTTGRVVGRIYAFSTLGSIAGTFVTGFYLIARFGTRATLVGTGVVLILTALILGGLFSRRVASVVAVIAAIVATAFALEPRFAAPPGDHPRPDHYGIVHAEESQYYTIRVERTVREDTGAPIHALHLDHLVHSYSDPEDAAYLEYAYLRIFRDIVGWKAQKTPALRLLFIGGGGYTLPRLLEQLHPQVEIDVVEIDPAVTRTAHRFFGMPRDTAIRTVNEDARWFAMRADGPYDVIFIDAFNDLSVPYHLTTRELKTRLRELLAPGGAIVANVIDDARRGRFLASYVRTLESVFGPGHVIAVAEAPDDIDAMRATFVVIASDEAQAIASAASGFRVPANVLQGGIVLTDDHAPVDNMLAPLFAARFVDEVE